MIMLITIVIFNVVILGLPITIINFIVIFLIFKFSFSLSDSSTIIIFIFIICGFFITETVNYNSGAFMLTTRTLMKYSRSMALDLDRSFVKTLLNDFANSFEIFSKAILSGDGCHD